ncbi:hypothetical protein OAM26_02145, partial [Porticoccaceae bacterium]|nr:hypothetical protein [Porticoccaceae bacterium]
SVIDSSLTGSTAVTVDHTLNITDVNEAPTGVGLDNTVSSVPLNLDNSVRTKLADIVITDDALGLNSVELGGADADLFEVEGSALYLSAGVIFDIDTKPQYNLTVTVQDEAFSSAVSTDFTLSVDPPEVFFNLSASSYPFAGGSVASGQSTSYGDSRTFDADLTYDIFIVIDGATNSLAALPSNHMWSGADNLGSDDQITLISKDGTGISVTAGRNDFANGLDARPNGSALTLTRQTDIRRSSYTQNIRLESDGQFYMYVRHWDGDLDYHSRGGWGYAPAQYPVDLWNGNFSVGSAPGFSLSARALWSDFVLVG